MAFVQLREHREALFVLGRRVSTRVTARPAATSAFATVAAAIATASVTTTVATAVAATGTSAAVSRMHRALPPGPVGADDVALLLPRDVQVLRQSVGADDHLGLARRERHGVVPAEVCDGIAARARGV